jgi:hypothetical protein
MFYSRLFADYDLSTSAKAATQSYFYHIKKAFTYEFFNIKKY